MAITALAVEESLDAIPQDPDGNPIPGDFEYFTRHEPPVYEYTYEFVLADEGFEAGEELYVAAHVALRNVYLGVVRFSAAAWGGGETFPGGSGSYFIYTVSEPAEPGPTPGSLVAWGRNDDGQCDIPPPNSGFTAISAGARHSLGLKADG